MNERRKADRYPLGVRIEFEGGHGLTRDVSGLGVLFDTDVEFGIGDLLDFLIVIPDAVNVQCQGKVVRVGGASDIGIPVGVYGDPVPLVLTRS